MFRISSTESREPVEMKDESVSSLGAADIEQLSALVTGPVSLPGSAEYAAECATYNLTTPVRPAVAIGVTSVADVCASVRFAVERGLPVAVLATGHQVACAGDGAVLVNLSRMSAAHVDAARRVARVEGGARANEAVQAAQQYGLAPLTGGSPTVGIAGFSLGGGYSPVLGRTYGYAADHVQAIELVTADGELRRATASEAPDLFWALRGGKGNFGVITALEVALFPVTRYYGGGLFYAAEHAAAVLHAWREWVVGLPTEVTSSIAFLRRPQQPFAVHLRFASLGAGPDAERVLAPMRALAPTIMDTVGETPYRDVGTLHLDPTQPVPRTEDSTSLRELPREAADVLLRALGPDSGTHLDFMELQFFGGALEKPPAVPNAVTGRHARWIVIAAGTGKPDRTQVFGDELTVLAASLAPWAQHEMHVNFLPPRNMTQRQLREIYGAERYDRLAAIKQRYDPGNVFRINHNIVPNGG